MGEKNEIQDINNNNNNSNNNNNNKNYKKNNNRNNNNNDNYNNNINIHPALEGLTGEVGDFIKILAPRFTCLLVVVGAQLTYQNSYILLLE